MNSYFKKTNPRPVRFCGFHFDAYEIEGVEVLPEETAVLVFTQKIPGGIRFGKEYQDWEDQTEMEIVLYELLEQLTPGNKQDLFFGLDWGGV